MYSSGVSFISVLKLPQDLKSANISSLKKSLNMSLMLNPLLFSPLLNLKGTKPNIQRPPL